MRSVSNLSQARAAWPFSNYPLNHAMRLSLGCALLGWCLGTVGVLAFIFSVASSEDDSTQQEFVQSSKPRQFTVVNYRAAGGIRTFRISTVRPALVANRSSSIKRRRLIGHVLTSGDDILEAVVRSGTGDRSPPPNHPEVS